MRMGSAIVRGSAGVVAVLAAAFILGFGAETTPLLGERWSFVLTVIVPLALLLTAALAASLGEKVTLLTAVSAAAFGLVAGCLAGMVFVLGASSPFVLELGGRDLNELGGDEPWDVRLALGLIFWGAAGAVVGAACGIAGWAVRFGLGQMRSEREGDTTEAGR